MNQRGNNYYRMSLSVHRVRLGWCTHPRIHCLAPSPLLLCVLLGSFWAFMGSQLAGLCPAVYFSKGRMSALLLNTVVSQS